MQETTDYGDVLDRWYKCNISRKDLKALMQRNDRDGLIHITLYFGLLIGLGVLAYTAIGTAWMIPAFFLYGTVYCFTNHMMHETHHHTPFKTLWLNETVHWIASFLNGVEPIFNRWGHTQHHTYTYFYGQDPEVETRRPAQLWYLAGKCVGIGLVNPVPIIKHALGIITAPAKVFVPQTEWRKMIWSSRFWLLGYALIIASCFVFGTILPLVYTLFARFYGALLAKSVDYTQHIGLESDVFDHRRCTRDVEVNPVLRFLYWNMNYHIEHHMFPMVPFHSLSKLHAKIKDQLPPTYKGLFAVYRELIPTVLRQQREPNYCVTPAVPEKQNNPA